MIKTKVLLLVLLTSTATLGQYQPIATASDGEKDPKALTGEKIFLEGMKLYWAEKYSEAIDQFKSVNEKYQETAGNYYMIAKSYKALSNLNQAQSAAEKGLAIDKNNVELGLYCAGLQLDNNDFKASIDTYKSLLKKNRNLLDAYIGLTEVYLAQEDFQKAIDTYDDIEKNIGVTEEITRQKQSLYLRMNDVDNAIAEGDRLIETEPKDSEYVLEQARLLLQSNKLKEAQNLLEESVRLNSSFGKGYILLAELYQKQGNKTASKNALQEAFGNKNVDIQTKISVLESYLAINQLESDIDNNIALCETLIEADPAEPKPYVFLGDLYMQKDELEKAFDAYHKSTIYDKSSFEVWMALIEIGNKTQQYNDVVTVAREATEYFPNQAFFWYHLGVAQLNVKNYDEALYGLDEAEMLTFDNDNLLKNILVLRGDIYSYKGDPSKASKAYEDALEIDENYETALNNYSYFLSTQRANNSLALKLAEKLIEKDSQNPKYVDTYAKALFVNENYDEAQEALAPLIKKNKAIPSSLELNGDIFFKKGKVEEAMKYWKLAQDKGATGLIEQKINQGKYIE